MSRLFFLFALFSIFLQMSCSNDDEGGGPDPDPDPDPDTTVTYSIVEAFPNLTFDQPVFLTHGGDSRIFVVERDGRILVFPDDSLATSTGVFLDLSAQVETGGGEQGLLGLVFHPQYSATGRFYVNYSEQGTGKTIVSEFTVSSDPNLADTNSEQVLLQVNQPFSNHNGGMLAFGPDGLLYIGMGDGGSGGDPQNHGQDRTTLLGAMLRIDINSVSAPNQYGIPPTNPLVGNSQGFREEIFAYGLRNPWRFSFDDLTGDLWLGDVGQNAIEEIDLIVIGGNYGWNIMEGTQCFLSSNCGQTGLELPVVEYDHSLGQSVTGGYVYRGQKFPGLQGYYLYGDFISGRIWRLNTVSPAQGVEELIDTNINISSFGVNQENELFLLDYGSGKIFTITSDQ